MFPTIFPQKTATTIYPSHHRGGWARASASAGAELRQPATLQVRALAVDREGHQQRRQQHHQGRGQGGLGGLEDAGAKHQLTLQRDDNSRKKEMEK